MKVKIKKMMVVLLLALILCSAIPINTFAAFITDINGNARFGIIQNSLNSYGHELHYAQYDGVTYLVFCCQYGSNSPSGQEYVYNSDFIAQYKEQRAEYEKIAEYIYFGYTMKHGMGLPTTAEAIRDACATQQFVWEYINNNITSQYGAPSRNSWNSNYMSSSIYNNWLSQTEAYYNQYHTNVSFNNSNNKVDIGDEVVYTDTNGALQYYDSFEQNINGITFTHTKGSNDLKVSVASDCESKATFVSKNYGLYQLLPNGEKYNSSSMSNYVYFSFTSGKVQNVIFSNYVDPSMFNISVEVQSGKITIVKQDSETGKIAQGDAILEGAVYEVYAAEDIYNTSGTKKYYANGDLVATRTTKADGTTEVVDKLPLGKYLIKETSSSEGYLLDSKEYLVNLKDKDPSANIVTKSVTSNEVVKKMQIHIFKSGIDKQSGVVQGLEGAEFTIKLESEVQEAYSKGYTYVEVWNGVDENGNKITVDKNRVAEAQKIAPSYAVMTTDSEGNAYSEEKLPYGKYIGKETVTPKDFESAGDFTFSITKDDSEVQEIAQKVKDIIINNEQLEAYIKLVKKDKDTGKTVTLNNATFQIKAAEDVYDRGNGKLLYKAGDVITQKIGNTTYDSFTTNANNIVVADNSYSNENDDKGTVTTPLKLKVGSYEITEIKVPEGFLELESPVKFEVEGIRDYDKDQGGDFVKTVEIENDQPTGTVIVDKTVAIRENVDTSLVDISDLSGIEFRLTAKEDVISPIDGSVLYKAGQKVGVYNLSKEGNLEINELPMGNYELQETKTLKGLVLNDKKYEVKFTQKDTVTKIYEEKLDIKNDTTLVEFSKTDITGEGELEGAELTVTDKNNNIVDKWVSTNETHKIEGLNAGETYTLKEEFAPNGYVQATEIQFTVENTNEIQKVEMIDKIVNVLKTDVDGNPIEGVSLVITNTRTKNIVDKWTTTNEPHNVSGLIEGETYVLHEEQVVGDFVKAKDIEFTVSKDKETQTIKMVDKTLEVTKTDLVTGEELEGAELQVTDKDGNIIDKWTSGKEPHKVTGLTEGETYVLTEITCPYGYEQAESIEFTVSEDKETQKIEMKDMPILQDVKLIKKDSNTNEVIKEKFTFGLYKDEGCNELIKTVDSNKEEGTVTFDDLRYGTYFIKELESPKGYVLSNKVLKLEINDQGVFLDGQKIEGENDLYTFDFYNTPVDTPKTGDNSNFALWASILGLSAITIAGIGIREIKKRKTVNRK